jgi:trehalose 6-phosphate phosphatase
MSVRPHWRTQEAQLRALLATPRFGVISDFDGTLSPFTEIPNAATIAPANAAALDRLLALGVPVALLSGRSAGDLRARFTRPALTYVGNHGLDYWDGATTTLVEEARPWRVALTAVLDELPPFDDPAILIENKGVTATIHYRATADQGVASAAIEAAVRPLCERHGLALNSGNQIWEIKPPLALNKGTALAAIVAARGLDSILFLGDDTTDLLAMAELRRLRAPGDDGVAPLQGVSVGVLHGDDTPVELDDFCDLVATDPDDVARLFDWLADTLAARDDEFLTNGGRLMGSRGR